MKPEVSLGDCVQHRAEHRVARWRGLQLPQPECLELHPDLPALLPALPPGLPLPLLAAVEGEVAADAPLLGFLLAVLVAACPPSSMAFVLLSSFTSSFSTKLFTNSALRLSSTPTLAISSSSLSISSALSIM